MRNFIVFTFAGLLLTAGLAFAQQAPAPLDAAERQQRKDRAHALKEQAQVLRDEADQRYKVEYEACWKKFLVQSCMDARKLEKQERIIASRKLEQEARDIERELRHIEGAEREARWSEELPKRDAENASRAEKNRQAQQAAMERVEKKHAEAEARGK